MVAGLDRDMFKLVPESTKERAAASISVQQLETQGGRLQNTVRHSSRHLSKGLDQWSRRPRRR